MATGIHDFPARHAATGVALAVVWGVFAYRHVLVFLSSGNWTYLAFCFSETLQAALFIFRRPPVSVSARRSDWAVAIAGTVLPMFLQPHPGGLDTHGGGLVLAGLVMQVLGLVSLNRSFAIVAAKRQIRTQGMYRLLRHPIYSAYLLLFSGYVWGNTTAWNVSLYCLFVVCLLIRVAREERHLWMDAEYRAYTDAVRYRLIPFVY
jgi:protein-S-isoprenylcysteine O-methyltransferase Ste14